MSVDLLTGLCESHLIVLPYQSLPQSQLHDSSQQTRRTLHIDRSFRFFVLTVVRETYIWTDWSIEPIQSIESHFIFSGDWNLVGKNHIYTELDTAEPSLSCDGENSKLLCQTQERYVKWRTLNRHNWLKTRMRSHNSLMREKCQFTAQLNPLFWLCQISVLLEIFSWSAEIFSQPVGPENWAPCPGVATERSVL